VAAEQKKPITPEGYAKLRAEMDTLWHVDRPKLVNEVADAAALGDRSENAEYIFGKKKLREIDKRIRYLSILLDHLTAVTPLSMKSDRVRFGCHVTVADENGKERTYQVVGEDEVDAANGRISMKSPLGKALMDKKVGDIAAVVRPAGDIDVEIVKLEYR